MSSKKENPKTPFLDSDTSFEIFFASISFVSVLKWKVSFWSLPMNVSESQLFLIDDDDDDDDDFDDDDDDFDDDFDDDDDDFDGNDDFDDNDDSDDGDIDDVGLSKK